MNPLNVFFHTAFRRHANWSVVWLSCWCANGVAIILQNEANAYTSLNSFVMVSLYVLRMYTVPKLNLT